MHLLRKPIAARFAVTWWTILFLEDFSKITDWITIKSGTDHDCGVLPRLKVLSFLPEHTWGHYGHSIEMTDLTKV